MGVAGLRISSPARSARRGRRLTIRSPSILVSWMLDITGLADIVNVEGADQGRGRLGPEQTAAVPGTCVTTEAGGITRHLRRVTAIPAQDDVVEGALGPVVDWPEPRSATPMGEPVVAPSRHLVTVAASDQTILDMDASGEGLSGGVHPGSARRLPLRRSPPHGNDDNVVATLSTSASSSPAGRQPPRRLLRSREQRTRGAQHRMSTQELGGQRHTTALAGDDGVASPGCTS